MKLNTQIMKEKMIMFTVSHLKIMTAKHVLSEAGIEAFSVDKRDSAHVGLWGDIELYVREHHAERAREILEEEEVLN